MGWTMVKYLLHFFPYRFLFNQLLFWCRGCKDKEKCPIAISDIMLVYNQAQDGLYRSCLNDCTAFNSFSTFFNLFPHFLASRSHLSSSAEHTKSACACVFHFIALVSRTLMKKNQPLLALLDLWWSGEEGEAWKPRRNRLSRWKCNSSSTAGNNSWRFIATPCWIARCRLLPTIGCWFDKLEDSFAAGGKFVDGVGCWVGSSYPRRFFRIRCQWWRCLRGSGFFCAPPGDLRGRQQWIGRILFIWSTTFSGIWVSRQRLMLSRWIFALFALFSLFDH